MDFAMMKQIMKNAIMMEGTVADHASILIFVQIALVFQILLTMKYPMSLLEMDFVMTKPTTKIAILMEETVAIQNFFTTKCKFSNVKHGSNHEMPFKMGIFSFE